MGDTHDIDVVAIGRAYIGVNEIGHDMLDVVLDYHKKKVPYECLITAAGRVFITLLTQHHRFVEDFFADMINDQAHMIRKHNEMSPDCDAFRRLH